MSTAPLAHTFARHARFATTMRIEEVLHTARDPRYGNTVLINDRIKVEWLSADSEYPTLNVSCTSRQLRGFAYPSAMPICCAYILGLLEAAYVYA